MSCLISIRSFHLYLTFTFLGSIRQFSLSLKIWTMILQMGAELQLFPVRHIEQMHTKWTYLHKANARHKARYHFPKVAALECLCAGPVNEYTRFANTAYRVQTRFSAAIPSFLPSMCCERFPLAEANQMSPLLSGAWNGRLPGWAAIAHATKFLLFGRLLCYMTSCAACSSAARDARGEFGLSSRSLEVLCCVGPG